MLPSAKLARGVAGQSGVPRHDIACAELTHGRRLMRLELRGLPFGRARDTNENEVVHA
jgi:hypothetical protein